MCAIRKNRLAAAVLAAAVSAVAVSARADDVFYRRPMSELKLTEGAFPKVSGTESPDWRLRTRAWHMAPYAVLDGPGEAYCNAANFPNPGWAGPAAGSGDASDATRDVIVVRAPAGKTLTGTLFYPKPDLTGMVRLRFEISAAAADKSARRAFFAVKKAHYERLLGGDVPGGAWFRHEGRQADAALRKKPAAKTTPARNRRGVDQTELERTCELLSGGRAVSENLQLDRLLPEGEPGEAVVDVTSIAGITVPEIDWRPLVKDLKPQLDPLASAVPADQHAVFFPSFAAAAALADEADRQSLPVLQLAETRSENALTTQRYQRQLGLSLTGLGRLVGPQVVKTLALTGSDPYFRTGTDVTVLFEARDAALLEQLLLAQVALLSAKEPAAKAQEGEIAGVRYHATRSPDRRVCSYIARIGQVVLATNSPQQLQRLGEVAAGQAPSIAGLPEFVFFRNRYPRGDAAEDALVFLSDATIRRWCGPRWRIASSRRTRDAAVMAQLQADQLDRLVAGGVQPGPLYTDLPTAEPEEFSLTAEGVNSSVQGTLEFLTPIAERPLAHVTADEAAAYLRWRDAYQQNWRWAFDPIALRLTVRKERLAGDLTVMPMIVGSEYREMAAVSRGAQFGPHDGDPHAALAQALLALNTQSAPFREADSLLSSLTRGSGAVERGVVGLGWVGHWVTLFADDDPFWQELAATPSAKRNEFLAENWNRLPVGLEVDVANNLRLIGFLAGARTFIEQTVPAVSHWETVKYKDRSYVKITVAEHGLFRPPSAPAKNDYLLYAATGDRLIVSFREEVLQRALDRSLACQAAGQPQPSNPSPSSLPPAAALTPQPPQPEWLGKNAAIDVQSQALHMLAGLMGEDYQYTMQARSWGNLPILNQWKHRYPDQDPVQLHERFWQVRLECPGGGRYVWNDRWQTMESTVYGHPSEPKLGPVVPAALLELRNARFGLTFEPNGLRAAFRLERDAAAKLAAVRAAKAAAKPAGKP